MDALLLHRCGLFLYYIIVLFHSRHGFVNSKKSHHVFTLKRPTGLHIIDSVTMAPLMGLSQNGNVCLVMHNSICLAPNFRKVFESDEIITAAQCGYIVDAAEKYAVENGGWTTQRHQFYPTTDLTFGSIFGEGSLFQAEIEGKMYQVMADKYGLDVTNFNLDDLFVAKYSFGEDGSRTGLGVHMDGNPWSFVIALNQADLDFSGGGTHFVVDGDVIADAVGSPDQTYRPDKGCAVVFNGRKLHEGLPITSGVRYILAGFCQYDCPSWLDRRTFLSEYDSAYDGNAAGQGVYSGDVLKGLFVTDMEGPYKFTRPEDIMTVEEGYDESDPDNIALCKAAEERGQRYISVKCKKTEELQMLLLKYFKQQPYKSKEQTGEQEEVEVEVEEEPVTIVVSREGDGEREHPCALDYFIRAAMTFPGYSWSLDGYYI